MEGTSASASSSMPYENRDATTRKRKRSTPSTTCYQVFINHRGPDVKKTLASVIYQYLQRQGLQVFFDKDELQPGQPLDPTIEDAIKTSSVHIAIFSETYAESSWCLKELCLMLETEAPIIPVFYDVRPNDLRWIEKGKYASAFEKHEKQGRFDFPTISAWKSALQKVSYISGLDLQDPNTLNGDWGQLLKSLEDTVSQNLKPGPVVVTTDPVGLDEAIRDFESFVQREQQNKNEEVKIVGIVGLGGSGKTTLATEIFNRRRPSFERSSFLFTREDAGNKKPLPQLQSQLLQDLIQVKDCTIRSVYEGIPIIREKLQSLISPSSPVLIVVDDIDDASQVEALAVKDALGSGSLIILTSRDEQLLKPSDASIYKIKALSTQNAQDLFCKHAFQQPYPTVGFENLVKKFCEKCGGWPLFLKLMGGHLRANASNDSKLWEDELKYTHKDILDIIELSYNALCKEEKQIFLDIACFFLGEDRDLAIKVWDTCEGRGLLRLNILVNKCLVELDDNNCFKMHDRVRDFGREIANTESPCRLWNESQAANFRGQAKATKEVRGIMAATSLAYFDFFGGFRSFYKPPLEGIELSALKILAIDGACIDEQVCGTLKNLVWLRWFGCPHKNIPPWLISMKNLTVLEFIEGEIEVWPVRGEQVHLKELRIALTNLSMISTSQNVCSNLEHLDLHANIRLKKVEHLPRKLVKLNLKDCMLLEDVQALEHLPQLRDLDISKCSELCELPKLQHLPSLETLDAFYCSNLQRIQGLEDLLHLRNLKISHCYKLCELPNLQHLPSLETLDASSCSNLHRIQGLEDLLHLRNLNISGCSELRELPKLQDLPSLETFDAFYCTNLQRIQGLEQLPQLRNLSISGCSELRELPKLQDLPSLETLDASYCSNLQRIQGLEQLPQLRNLNIPGCYELQEFPNLAQLISLEEFKADGCWKLHGIQGLDQLEKLKLLTLSADDSGTIWNVLEDMKKLPGSTCVSANVEDLNIRPVIDLNIRLIELREMQPNVREWEFIGENRPTCFMICLVVQFPTVRFQRDFRVVMKYKKGRIDWKMRVNEGEWVYALICSREYNSVERISVWTSLSRAYLVFGDEDSENDADVDRIGVWTSLCPADVVFGDGDDYSENEAECSEYELKERWMEGGSEAKILEAAKKLFAP